MTTTADHLAYVLTHWPSLTDMLDTRHSTSWPPVMGIARLLDAEEREQRAQARADERADSTPDALGEAPAPLRLTIIDVMRTVEQDLVHCADVIAAEVQRPAMSRAPRGLGWLPKEIARRDELADADAADLRRWLWPRLAVDAEDRRTRPEPTALRITRTTEDAALWLDARLEGARGPFLPLTTRQRDLIEETAAKAAAAVEAALDLARLPITLDRPCPNCYKDRLRLHSGDGQPPMVACADCGRAWREREPAA